MARERLYYLDFEPIPGDPARRYYSPSTGETLSVRQFQKLAHEQAGTVPERVGAKPRQPPELKAELAARRKATKASRQRDKDIRDLQRYYKVAHRLRTQRGLGKALRQEGLSRKTFDRLNRQEDNYVYRNYTKGGRPYETDEYVSSFAFPVFAADGTPSWTYIDVGRAQASIMGSYYNAVDELIQRGNPHPLAAFADGYVVDIYGDMHELPDAATIRFWYDRLDDQSRKDFHEHLYLIVKGESIKNRGLRAA